MRWVLLAWLAIGSCYMKTTEPDYPTEVDDSCMVFFYRDAKVGGAAVTFEIYDKGEWIGALRVGSYFAYRAAPGPHQFTAMGEVRSTRSIQCQPGQTFYFRSEAQEGYFTAHATLELMNDDGPAAIKNLKYNAKNKTGSYSTDPNYNPDALKPSPSKPKKPEPSASFDQTTVCGNGLKERGEQCDRGKENSNAVADRCRTDCTFPRCGDGMLDSNETCDDGNVSDGDGCPALCSVLSTSCGNGLTETGEECDEGGANSDEFGPCLLICRIKPKAPEPVCGNGIVEAKEKCDDGNQSNDDICRNNCQMPRCGDGTIDPGEACDDGNNKNYDRCNFDCTRRTGG
jgi:cysteine-rich repeat protein